jgi:hypothetical protein
VEDPSERAVADLLELKRTVEGRLGSGTLPPYVEVKLFGELRRLVLAVHKIRAAIPVEAGNSLVDELIARRQAWLREPS